MQAEKVLNHIPIGKKNAISRKRLRLQLCIPDREVRELLSELRKRYAILNLSDGKGYFIPDPKCKTDIAATIRYIRQEENRKRNVSDNLPPVYNFLLEVFNEQ